jgi:hypothetical protein
MAEQAALPATELIDHAAVDRAHALANKEALLEHARMGRSVCESRDGQVVWVAPSEIFARYGLDENGRPKPETKENTSVQDDDPLLLAQMEQWREAERLENEGQLKEYRGEYVIFGAGTIFAHGRNLLKTRIEAEELAAAKGISPDHLIDYFVPGE